VIEGLPCHSAVVLPNNKNVILAAQQARDLSDKQVAVVPTRNVPQGIAAMLAFNPELPLAENVARMEAALDSVQCGEITSATRTVELDGVSVAEGQIIGLHNGQLVTAGDDLTGVVESTLERMGAAGGEIITLYYGLTVSATQAQALAAHMRERFAGQEIEVVAGGQPHYHYILSTE
jgi:hypothetical protein